MPIPLKLFALTSMLLISATSVFASNTYLNEAGALQTDSSLQEHNSIGLGFVYGQNIYDGVDNKIQPFPLFNITYDNYFIQGITAGYNTYKDESFSFAFVVQPQFGGYESDESEALAGMRDTSYLINTGVQAEYHLLPFAFTFAALHDITGRSAGNSASAKMAVMVPMDDRRFMLIPSIAVTWEDSDITGYYYGVSSGESTASRSQYSPSGAMNMNYGLTMKYRMAENWTSTLGYMLTQYDSEISNSPIVSRQYASTLLVGISYLF